MLHQEKRTIEAKYFCGEYRRLVIHELFMVSFVIGISDTNRFLFNGGQKLFAVTKMVNYRSLRNRCMLTQMYV